MSSNIDQTVFCCALANDNHFIENPVTLSCGHSICKRCVPKKIEDLLCKICGEKNEIDLTKVKESIGMKKLLLLNLEQMLGIVRNRYNESINLLQNEIKNASGRVEIEIEYVKTEIELRVESIKIELDELKEKMFNELNGYKREMQEQLSTFNYDSDQVNLKNIENELENHNFNEKSFYDYQSNLKELNKQIKKLQQMNHNVSIKLKTESESISVDQIGTIACNFTGIQGRVKLGNYKIIELRDDPNDLCILPNGNLLFSNYFTSKQLSVYDDNFVFIKNVSKINEKEINPFSVETNNKDKIYINNWTKIFMTDLDFNYLSEYGSNTNDLNGPCFMLFYDESLYVCDMDNKSILKLNSDLKPQSRIHLNIKPIQIQVIGRLACIIPENKDEFFYFYDLHDLNLKHKYNRCVNSIAYENRFFCINGILIDCFNKDGSYADSIRFNVAFNFSTCPFMKIKNSKLLYHRCDKKLFIL